MDMTSIKIFFFTGIYKDGIFIIYEIYSLRGCYSFTSLALTLSLVVLPCGDMCRLLLAKVGRQVAVEGPHARPGLAPAAVTHHRSPVLEPRRHARWQPLRAEPPVEVVRAVPPLALDVRAWLAHHGYHAMRRGHGGIAALLGSLRELRAPLHVLEHVGPQRLARRLGDGKEEERRIPLRRRRCVQGVSPRRLVGHRRRSRAGAFCCRVHGDTRPHALQHAAQHRRPDCAAAAGRAATRGAPPAGDK